MLPARQVQQEKSLVVCWKIAVREKIEIVIMKNISRFGRDIVEILDVLNRLKILGIRVIVEQKELDIANTDSDLMISIIESLARAENESRSDNIRWEIKQRVTYGTSRLYDRKY